MYRYITGALNGSRLSLFLRENKNAFTLLTSPTVPENKMTNNDFDFLLFANETLHQQQIKNFQIKKVAHFQLVENLRSLLKYCFHDIT